MRVRNDLNCRVGGNRHGNALVTDGADSKSGGLYSEPLAFKHFTFLPYRDRIGTSSACGENEALKSDAFTIPPLKGKGKPLLLAAG